LNASDRRLIWSLIGGEQRAATSLVDSLVEDDVAQISAAVHAAFVQGRPAQARSERVAHYLALLARVDPAAIDGAAMRQLWNQESL